MRATLARRAIALSAAVALAVGIVMHLIGRESLAEAFGAGAFFALLAATFIGERGEIEDSS